MGSTSSGHDDVELQHNGTTFAQDTTNFISTDHRLNVSGYVQCVATDTISLYAFSTSGNTLVTGQNQTFMQALWVSE